MKRYAVAFTGPSNSGKTTLIEKIAKKLISTKKIAIIKHDPKDKAVFDIKGKDSYKFFQTGAEVIVSSPTKTTYFSHKKRDLDELIELFGEFDLLLVEGLREISLPRVAIFRNSIDSSYFKYCNAIAVDSSIKRDQIPSEIEILDLNNIDMIIEWIEKNAKEV